MLIRISLIVAIVAALATAALNFSVIHGRITDLTNDRNSQRDQKVAAQTELASTKKDLAATKDTLAQTQQALTEAQTARDKAVADDEAQTKRADDLNDKLTKTTQQLNDTQNKLAAYQATGMTSEQVAKLGKMLKQDEDALDVANQEKLVLIRTVTRLKTQLYKLTGPGEYIVKLPANLKGKVMVVDPKWEFVVLNVGEDQGVLEDGELLVSRNGKLVAKVVVRSVQKDRSIANILPGWKLGDVFEGDEVTPAHPAS
jgi:hypothetical protein